jgi:hypothetical protein
MFCGLLGVEQIYRHMPQVNLYFIKEKGHMPHGPRPQHKLGHLSCLTTRRKIQVSPCVIQKQESTQVSTPSPAALLCPTRPPASPGCLVKIHSNPFRLFSCIEGTVAENPEQKSFVRLVIKTGVTFKHSLDRMWQVTIFFV